MIGNLLRTARETKKMTMTDIANNLDFTRQGLSRIELAKNLREKTAIEYANMIGCDILVQIIDKDTKEVLSSDIITKNK